jgi:porin
LERGLLFLATALALACAASARAEEAAAPPFTLDVLETVDFWRNTQGGVAVGDTTLNKILVSASFDGERIGLSGIRAHIQVFKTNGESLSGGRTGDIQTASNIEAPSVTRLMSAWVEHGVGDKGLLRAGLMDLNLDFDSIDPAGLFLNSSHGIGAEIAQTGQNGPSIFPVSSAGVEGIWTPSPRFALKAAVFDGVSGDPAHPKAFVRVRLARSDGVLVIAQGDWKPADGVQVSLAAWGYTAQFDRIAPGAPPQHGQGGVYAFVEGPLGHGWTGWVRGGFADADVNPIGGYLGAGVVRTGLFGRKDDQMGLSVAHAALGSPIRRRDGLPSAETTVEATYLLQVTGAVALQPDVQFIRHPAGGAGLPDALAVGLRVIVAFKHPADSPADYD